MYANEAQQSAREQRGETRDGIEHHVADISRNGKDGEHGVGIRLEDGLGQEFARKEHHNGREQRVGRHTGTIAQLIEQRLVENLREEDTIDDQCDIVAHQHGRHKIVRMTVEQLYGALREAVLLTIHLSTQAVARHKGDLHA